MRTLGLALVLAIAAEGAYATDTVGGFRARQAARELLQGMEETSRRLQIAVMGDDSLYRSGFREPLAQAIDRFERTPGTTALERAPFESCATAARLLFDIGTHLRRGAIADWRLDSGRRYKDLLYSCRLSVNR